MMAFINTFLKRTLYLWVGFVVVVTASGFGGALFVFFVDFSVTGETVV